MTISYIGQSNHYFKLKKDRKMICGYIVKANQREFIFPNFYYLQGGLVELQKEIPDEFVSIIDFTDIKGHYVEKKIFDNIPIVTALKWASQNLCNHIY